MADPTPTPLEMLVQIRNQNAATIKELKAINGKLNFFIAVLIIAFVLQFLASLFMIG
jgi:hypothetical protein